jgi:hypothetical protein
MRLNRDAAGSRRPRSNPVSVSNAPVISRSHAPSDRDEQVEVRQRGRLSLVWGADHRFDDQHAPSPFIAWRT